MKKFKNKKEKKDILFNILLKSKNIYGDFLTETKKDLIPFIYGIRYNYSIICLDTLSLYLKRIFSLLKYIILKKKYILIIGNSNDINFLVNRKYIKNNKKIYFLNEKWINGLITNKNMNIKNIFLKKKIKLIIIIKSSINETFLNKELSLFNIPIISFLRTKQNIKNIDYPLVNNSKNITSIYTLMYLLRKNF